MEVIAYWFLAVFSYVVQTKGLSRLQSTIRDSERYGFNHRETTIFLAFIQFVPWLLLVPFSRLLSVSRPSAYPTSSITELEVFYEGGSILENNNGPNNKNTNNTDISGGYDNPNGAIKNHAVFEKFSYIVKLITLSLLLLIGILSYMNALSLTPAFDVAIIQNTSIFEITSLLYGVCGLCRRKNVLRNFMVMMIALIGIVLVSYTKTTCDLLSGKFSVNQKTGQSNDPFLFDRLKSCLLCGLGSLSFGPIAVLWHRWFNYSDRITVSHQCQHLTFIASICMVILLPFLPKALEILVEVPTKKFFWLQALVVAIVGTLPHVFALISISRETLPSYSTTVNLGSIIFMGIADWICEPTRTTVVCWEVVGYLMLSVSCLVLSIAYYEKKHIILR